MKTRLKVNTGRFFKITFHHALSNVFSKNIFDYFYYASNSKWLFHNGSFIISPTFVLNNFSITFCNDIRAQNWQSLLKFVLILRNAFSRKSISRTTSENQLEVKKIAEHLPKSCIKL